MNFKEWMFPLTFAMALTFLIQYFMGPQVPLTQENNGVSGQSYVAPELKQAQKPLSFDITFDTTETKEVVKHVVKTDLASYTFSSKGAILESLEFIWQNGKKNVQMLDAHQNCFLLALSHESPLYYTFEKEYALEDKTGIAIEYRAKFDQGSLIKTFVMYHNTYQVDVRVSIDYHQKQVKASDHVRLFFPMPLMVQDSADNETKAFKNKAVKSEDIVLQDIDLNKQAREFVFDPKAFGFSNKFVVQGFIKSINNSPMRGYFKPLDAKKYEAVLETVAVDKDYDFAWSFYCGPKTESALKAVDPYLVQTLDYGWFTFIAKPMMVVLKVLKEYLGNYGWAIILLTILLKLLLLPFTLKGEKSMRQGAELNKKMAYLKQKYKHDKEALDRATAELIQKHGIPGLSGCLPMFLNLPFFVSLNRILSSSIELYGAPFLWIQDLSACDPYYILGLLTAGCMLFTPMGNDSNPAMKYGTAIFLGTITMYFSAGLALFIFINTLMGLLQSLATKNKIFSFGK